MNWEKIKDLILRNARKNAEEYDTIMNYRFFPYRQKYKLIAGFVLWIVGAVMIFVQSPFNGSLLYHLSYIIPFYFSGIIVLSALPAWYRQGSFGKVYMIPLLIFSLVEPFFLAIYTISMFMGILLVSIPLIYTKLVPLIFDTQLTDASLLFLIFTTMALVSATWGDKLITVIGNFGWNGEENVIGNEFTLEILNQKKIRLFIFAAFFVCFSVFKISTFQELPIIGVIENFKEINNAILASFICYIAWDRMLVTYRDMRTATP